MLFKQPILREIEAARIELAFRRWSRPSVKEGGPLMTPVGVLAILAVEPIQAREITEAEARAAGHTSRAQLLAGLEGRRGDLYRIRFRLEGRVPGHAVGSSWEWKRGRGPIRSRGEESMNPFPGAVL
ncbi:MAG: hypothetical protein EA422_13035 [Gemmatimonadales bacterium]|nr:MAG: hypothetical protein EA422_13035 [Gemmatimonadales bacterium]